MIGDSVVYFLRPKGMEGPVKIGCSGMPHVRLEAYLPWSPFPLEIVATVPGEYALERNIHDCLAASHSHSEWFHATPMVRDLVAALQAGTPIGQALDLSDRVGNIRGKKRVLGLIRNRAPEPSPVEPERLAG
jgi:T5orf172 domain